MAAARRDREGSEAAALIGEILGGRAERALPACVAAALEELESARVEAPAKGRFTRLVA